MAGFFGLLELTGVGLSRQDILATVSKTLDNTSQSISASLIVGGDANNTLSSLSNNTSGVVLIQSTTQKTLDNLTKNILGTVSLVGQSSITLEDLALLSSSSTIKLGTLNKTLDSLSNNISGTILLKAVLNKTLNLTASVLGNISVNGNLSKSLSLISNISGQVVVSATLDYNLENLISGYTTRDAILNEALGNIVCKAYAKQNSAFDLFFDKINETSDMPQVSSRRKPHVWTEDQKIAKKIYDELLRGNIGLKPNKGIK